MRLPNGLECEQKSEVKNECKGFVWVTRRMEWLLPNVGKNMGGAGFRDKTKF